MAAPSPVIDVQFASATADTPGEADIRRWIEAALEAAGHNDAVEVSVRIVDTDEIQSLNREFRGKDRPTNVLSFPAGDGVIVPDFEARLLGDIVLCAAIVDTEAKEQHKAAEAHWAHMLVHGTLHLLGYDHECEKDANEMESLEISILAAHGLPDPYSAR